MKNKGKKYIITETQLKRLGKVHLLLAREIRENGTLEQNLSSATKHKGANE